MNSPFFSRIHFNENLTAFGEWLAAEPMQISMKKITFVSIRAPFQ